MKKFITIIFVVLILIGAVIYEQITINNYLSEIQGMTEELMTITSGKQNIQTEEIVNLVDNLEKTWKHHEDILCMIANHKDMRDLCVEIQRLQGNIVVNQYEDFTASLKIINHLSKDYRKIMGLSFHNVF